MKTARQSKEHSFWMLLNIFHKNKSLLNISLICFHSVFRWFTDFITEVTRKKLFYWINVL